MTTTDIPDWSNSLSAQLTDGTFVPRFVDPRSLAEDPHGTFARLRPHEPVIRFGDGQYMLLRAADVLRLKSDPRTRQVDGADYVRMRRIQPGAVAKLLRDFFLFSNGETHRTLRGLFSRAFSYPAMQAARPLVRAVADKIIEDLPRGESFDFVDGMAGRLPGETIAILLGLPSSEVQFFCGHVYEVARAVSPVYPYDDHDRIEASAKELFSYVEQHLLLRMGLPRDDLLSAIARSWREEEAIPFESLVHQVIGMIIGGSDTTRAAFAVLVSLLLERPDDWAATRKDPALIPGAIKESLRYEPSVGSFVHITVKELTIDGVTVPAGALLSLSTMSAMRDPAIYADPDRFDIRRTDHPRHHPVFGLGAHRCIGELLARIEMEEALTALQQAAPAIELEQAPRLFGFGGIRMISPMLVHIPE